MKTFDYSKTYYKVTNEEENHNGYQYRDGLNILEEEFNDNPGESCVPGGFYFTDYENLPSFFDFGIWIREIRIPEDARVVKDPEGDKWRTDKIIFGKKYHIIKDFDRWFNPDKFNWEKSWALAEYCPSYFDKWFDPEKFNWYYSYYLAQFCPEHFDKWFNPDKFNWEQSNYLAKFCSNHFDKWFDSEKYNWDYSFYLAEYCLDHFDEWFDKERFNYKCYSWILAKNCPDNFDKWFNPDKFNWNDSGYLENYCSEHRNQWGKYLKMKR